MVQIGGRKEVEPDLVRHMVLNSLRGYRSRFSDEYGELILCYDDKTNWRRDVFPNYKHSRCLLYTSPSPRDLSTSRMPSSA